MKKICVFLSVLLLLTAVIPTAGVAAGQKMLYSGTLGSCEWDIDQNWVLTIHEGSFTGDDLISQNPWPSFSSGTKVPGNVPFRENVKRITTDGAVFVRGSLRNAFSNFLTVKYADLSGFDTGNVTDMNGMFRYCTALESLDIRNFDLGNISDLIETFYKCDALKDINVTNVDEHGRAIIRSALPGKVAFITGNTPDPLPAPVAETPEPDRNKPTLPAGNTSFACDQLQLILDFLKIRNLEGYASSTPGYYAVTDLDHNGRLELLEAVGYSTKDVANLAHLEAYEVNESKTGLVSTGTGLYGNYSLLLEDGNPLVEDACYPDFEPQKGPTKLNAYSADGIWYYACSTYNVAGGKNVEEIKEWMYLDNGTLCIYPAAWRYFPSGSKSPYFFGSENNQITEKEYNNWETARFDSEKHTATIWWFTLLNGNTDLSFLENSYEAYINNKIQSAGVNSASSDIPDYKDYTSSGNTRPGNPTGIIPPIYINPFTGTPAGNGNNSAGQTQAGSANNAPPAGLLDKEKRDYSDNTSNSGAETWNAPVIYSNPYEQPKGTEDDPWGTAGAVYSIDPISGEIVVTYPDGEDDETNGFEYPDPLLGTCLWRF